MGKTKGVTANNYLRYVAAHATPQQLEEVKGRLDPAARTALYGGPLAAGALVDYGAVMQLLLAADKVVGKGDLDLLRQASRKNQEVNLNGVYKALLPFASPAFILEHASKLWQRYHDTGRLTAQKIAPGRVSIVLHDYPDIPLHHGPEIEGAFEGLLILAKAKLEKTVHTRCVNQGAPECEWEVAWTE